MYIHICPLGFSLFCYLQPQHSFDYAQFVGFFVYFLLLAQTVLVVNSISVASMMDIDAEDKGKVEDMVAMMMVVDEDRSRDNEKGTKGNEKGAKEAAAKNAYYNGSSSGGYNNKKAAATTAAAASGARSRAAKPRAAGKKASSSSSSNPYEFYYYSGFGPLWSKRRGDRSGGEGSRNGGENSIVAESENVAMTKATTTIAPSSTHDVVAANDNDTVQGGVVAGSCSEIDNVELDYVDIDDEEEEDGNDDESGKKRTRKPVKARSLKSLM